MGSTASAAKGKVQAALNPKDLQAKAEVAGDALLHPQRSMYTMADVAVGSVKSATVRRDEAFRTGEELKARHRVARIAGPLSFEHTTCPQEQRALGVKTAHTNADNELLAEKRRQARVARNKVAPPTSLGLATSAPRCTHTRARRPFLIAAAVVHARACFQLRMHRSRAFVPVTYGFARAPAQDTACHAGNTACGRAKQ
jgi:hypothetical protein